jgi:hypothetical protein
MMEGRNDGKEEEWKKGIMDKWNDEGMEKGIVE